MRTGWNVGLDQTDFRFERNRVQRDVDEVDVDAYCANGWFRIGRRKHFRWESWKAVMVWGGKGEPWLP